MGVNNKGNFTTEEIIEELKLRGKTSDEISKFLNLNSEEVPADSKKKKDENFIEETVTNILHEFGIPAHLKGYSYLRVAIILMANDSGYLNAVTKKLYPDIAKEFDATPSRVERAMRHAIHHSWKNGEREVFNKHFGRIMNKMPTTSEFIATIADEIKLKYMK